MTKYPRAEPGEGTQGRAIIKYLEKGKTLTALEALKLAGTMKLSTRISELKEAGYQIMSTWKILPNGKRVKQYYLDK